MKHLTMLAAALALALAGGQVAANPCTDRGHGPDASGYGSHGGAVHPNGGGWVVQQCVDDVLDPDDGTWIDCVWESQIPESVYVGPNSAVCSNSATVSGNVQIINSIVWWAAQISDNAVIRNSVIGRDRGNGQRIIISSNARVINTFINGGTISGNAKVSDGAAVTESAHVHGSAKVAGQGTRVFGSAEVYGNAVVRDGAWIYGNGKVNSGRYTRNARVSTDQTGAGLNVGGLLSNPINPGNTESGTD